MTMADSERGSSPADFNRLKVSRHESPASTRMRVAELCTIAQFPRLPLASTDTDTAMPAAYSFRLWKRDNFLGSRDFGAEEAVSHQPSALSYQLSALGS